MKQTFIKLIVVFSLCSCSDIDLSKTEELTNVFEKNMHIFLKENNYNFPKESERNMILESAGCDFLTNEKCYWSKKEYTIFSAITLNEYTVNILTSKSSCTLIFNSKSMDSKKTCTTKNLFQQ